MSLQVKVETILDSEIFNREIEKMPIFQLMIRDYSITKPFKDLKIGFSHVFASNTLPMIVTLIKGGAKLVLIIPNIMQKSSEIIKIVQNAEIPVLSKYEKFDFVIDCQGNFSTCPPNKGSVEVTRSGIHKYNKLLNKSKKFHKFKLLDVDRSITKLIETFLGNPLAVLKTLEFYKGDVETYISDKLVGIVGFGKIGRGLARELSKYTDIIVFDISKEVIDIALNLNYHAKLISNDSLKNSVEIQECDIILTATGYESSMSKYFEKKYLKNSLKINVGAVDEWGEAYSENEIFHSKYQPFNFNLEPPTESKYIDPILSLQVEGLKILIEKYKLFKMGYNSIPQDIDKKIVNQFEKYHGQVMPILKQYFPEIHDF